MKALFVHDHRFYKINNEYYSPGGLPSSAWNRYLKNTITELVVVSRGSKETNKDGLVKSSKKNVTFDLVYEVKGGIDYYRYAGLIKKRLSKHIQNVDFVIIRTPSFFGNYAYQLCKKMNKPYVTEVVGCVWNSHWNYGNIRGKVLAPFKFFTMRFLVRNSFATLYVTQHFLQNRYPTKAEITTYASNVQIPKVEVTVRDQHINFIKRKEPQKTLQIGIIGNIAIKYKGYDIAFKALKRLKDNHPEIKFKFSLVGGGDPSYINKLVKEYALEKEIEIVGTLKAGKEIFNFLDKLDLYIQPSLTEGLPRAVIEAMSRVCPILASSVGGIPELIEMKYLHKPGDDKKLYTDLKNILTNLEERISMANANFEQSKEYAQEILEERRFDFFKEAFKKIKLLK